MDALQISVAIATYNGEAFVEATLRSILGQSLKPFEVIVVDDGSTDGTAALLKSFEPNLSVIKIENSGPEAAKKAAIEATRGEWVAICDHDDLWDNDHLERLAKLVRKYPEVTTAYSNFAEFGNAARYPDKFKSLGDDYWRDCAADEDGFCIYGPSPYVKFLQATPFFPSASIFRRSIYEEIGGVRSCLSRNPSADSDLAGRMLLQGVIGCDHKITTRIRKYGGNFSGQDLKTLCGVIEVLEFQLNEGGIFASYKKDIRLAIERKSLILMQAAFSYYSPESFAFAMQRIDIKKQPMGLKLRYLVFRLPDFLRRTAFVIFRWFNP